MAYLSVVNNLSMYYSLSPITSDTVLDKWNRTFYDIDARAGDILITLPPIPTPANLLDSGSLMFRRIDTSGNTVQLRYTLDNITYYLYNVEADVTYTHWIMSVNDPTFDDQIQITRLSSQQFLKLAGGTMTGSLILNGDPTSPLEAATKNYVDTQVAVNQPTNDLGIDLAVSITDADSPYPLTVNQTTVNVDASSGSVKIDLPPIDNISTPVLNKRYIINRTDTMNSNVVQINCNSGSTDRFQRTPTGFNTYYLQCASTIQLVSVVIPGANVWVIESDSNPQYQSIPFDGLITSDTVLTYHGSLFTVYANSNIKITLPLCTNGVGSTKIIRTDPNPQYDVNLVAPSGHTVNGVSDVKLLVNGTATARTLSYGDSSLVIELAQSSSVAGSVLALRQSTGQTINNSTISPVTFDTNDTELAISPSNVGLTVTGGNTFTNYTGSAMTIIIAYQVQWSANGAGQRQAWVQRTSSSQRCGMVTSVPHTGAEGAVQSSSTTFSLASGDGFKICVNQSSGSALVLNGGGVGLPTGYAGRLQIARII